MMQGEIWRRLAWLAPRPLVYWAAIRMGAHATQGPWSTKSPTDLLFMDALERWGHDDAPARKRRPAAQGTETGAGL